MKDLVNKVKRIEGKSTMVCKTAGDILRESMGFSDEFCERFKARFDAAEYDR